MKLTDLTFTVKELMVQFVMILRRMGYSGEGGAVGGTQRVQDWGRLRRGMISDGPRPAWGFRPTPFAASPAGGCWLTTGWGAGSSSLRRMSPPTWNAIGSRRR